MIVRKANELGSVEECRGVECNGEAKRASVRFGRRMHFHAFFNKLRIIFISNRKRERAQARASVQKSHAIR